MSDTLLFTCTVTNETKEESIQFSKRSYGNELEHVFSNYIENYIDLKCIHLYKFNNKY